MKLQHEAKFNYHKINEFRLKRERSENCQYRTQINLKSVNQLSNL